MNRAVLAALLLAVAAGCRVLPYFVGLDRAPIAQRAPMVSHMIPADSQMVPSLEAGREIYVTRCARCHAPLPIRDFTLEEWTGTIIPRMAPKAKLTAKETEWLVAYVDASKRQANDQQE